MSNWSEPFIPTKSGQGPEGVSIETHDIRLVYDDDRLCDGVWGGEPMWAKGLKYRYRPRAATATLPDPDGWWYYVPQKLGEGPQGVTHLTHQIQGGHGKREDIQNPDWNVGAVYRYRPRTGTTKPSGADGSAYYDLTIKGVTISCNDVIDALGLNFNSGNEFKAIWRDGRKQGVDRRYDLEKRVYFATRELENHNND